MTSKHLIALEADVHPCVYTGKKKVSAAGTITEIDSLPPVGFKQKHVTPARVPPLFVKNTPLFIAAVEPASKGSALLKFSILTPKV